jgi:hypothetical protein
MLRSHFLLISNKFSQFKKQLVYLNTILNTVDIKPKSVAHNHI